MTEEEKKAAKEAKAAKKAAEKAAKEAEDSQTADRKYSKEEVQAMLQQVISKTKGEEVSKEKDNRKKVRLARIDSKLVVDFVNQNHDEFLVDTVIHAYNKWNDLLKQNEAWIEVKFDDDTTKHMPLLYLCSNARPFPCPVIREERHDTSYSLGKVERRVYDDSIGNMKGAGVEVDQIVKQEELRFIISTPDGREFSIPSYVVNII